MIEGTGTYKTNTNLRTLELHTALSHKSYNETNSNNTNDTHTDEEKWTRTVNHLEGTITTDNWHKSHNRTKYLTGNR